MVTYWDSGFGRFNWVIWKNVIVCVFGVLALYFGTADSVKQIIAMYSPQAANANTTTIAIDANSS